MFNDIFICGNGSVDVSSGLFRENNECYRTINNICLQIINCYQSDLKQPWCPTQTWVKHDEVPFILGRYVGTYIFQGPKILKIINNKKRF